ncbi:MAG: ATP-dependent DNA ligase [Methanomassiliicoccales archaeon]
MLFRELARVYEEVESRSSRLEMTELLANFLRQVDCASIDKVVYLTQGQLYPDFYPNKLGLADRLLMKTMVMATGMKEETIKTIWLKEGDPGKVAQQVFQSRKQMTLFSEPLTLERVYANLVSITEAEGAGSQELKMKLLSKLLSDATMEEAKFISRIVTGKMRLGVASMTLVDALALAFASKEERDEVERAFNITSDLGKVAKVLCSQGIEAVRGIKVTVGSPLRSMLAERMRSPREILERLGGKAAFEYKYDGVRVQAHITQEGIKLYSRRLEDLTSQFPDVSVSLRASFRGSTAIVEGECVPVDVNTGELLPFQEVSHRRGRKHGLEDAVEEYPVKVFLFDCVYLDGEDLSSRPFLERRRALESAFTKDERVAFSEMRILSHEKEVDEFFQEALKDGCEGLMAKSIGPDSVYRAGARGFLWIKYKKEYRSEMTDTVDLVVVGAFAGRGKRAGLYGALLMATYNELEDVFETVCKLGSGFDDATLASLPALLEPYKLGQRHPRVRSRMEADHWFEPAVVLEVLGAEITVSPIHTAAMSKVRDGSGLAIRFPRFSGRVRTDKGPREATTSQELEEMYHKQLKTIEG